MQKGSLLMHQRDESALTIRDISGEQHIGGSCLASNPVDEIVEPLARLGREQNGLRIATTETQSIDAIEKIDFIEYGQRSTLSGADLIKHAVDSIQLPLIVLVRRIYDFEN